MRNLSGSDSWSFTGELIAHLGSHTLKEVRLILAIFGQSLHKKSELTWELCVVCSSLILGCGLESRNHIPLISISGGQQKHFEGRASGQDFSPLFVMFWVVRGFTRVFEGFEILRLQILRLEEARISANDLNLGGYKYGSQLYRNILSSFKNNIFKIQCPWLHTYSIVVYIKLTLVDISLLSAFGHEAFFLLPAFNWRRALQMEAFLGYSNYPRLFQRVLKNIMVFFMHYLANSLEITLPPHFSWIILATLVFLGFWDFWDIWTWSLPPFTKTQSKNALQMEKSLGYPDYLRIIPFA